jgi:ubiquinone/menaquinone biosynthesis C-methylase UbiE
MNNTDQIANWNERSGPRWVAMQRLLDAQLAPFGDAALARLPLAAGMRVLDVGCGCGDTTLRLADAVGPAGLALGVDVSAPMLARARERSAGRADVAFVEADAQTHAFEGRFDALYSRFGVMFFDDPAAAFARLHAALVPGAPVVWFEAKPPVSETSTPGTGTGLFQVWISPPISSVRVSSTISTKPLIGLTSGLMVLPLMFCVNWNVTGKPVMFTGVVEPTGAVPSCTSMLNMTELLGKSEVVSDQNTPMLLPGNTLEVKPVDSAGCTLPLVIPRMVPTVGIGAFSVKVKLTTSTKLSTTTGTETIWLAEPAPLPTVTVILAPTSTRTVSICWHPLSESVTVTE